MLFVYKSKGNSDKTTIGYPGFLDIWSGKDERQLSITDGLCEQK